MELRTPCAGTRPGAADIEPAEREHGGRALHDKPPAKARQTKNLPKFDRGFPWASAVAFSRLCYAVDSGAPGLVPAHGVRSSIP